MVRQIRKNNREETEETRHKILQVARQLFMEFGYRSVTTRQVAQECGITQPALYYHFSDKQELYVAILVEMLQQMKVALEAIIQKRELGVQARLVEMAVFLLQFTRHDISTMFHDIEHELDAVSQEKVNLFFYEGELHPIIALVEEGIREGLIPDPTTSKLTPMTAAYLFLGLVSSFIQQPSEEGLAQSNLERANALVQFYLHGLTGT